MMTTTAHDLRNCFLIFHSSVRSPPLATTWSLQSSLFISISDTIYFAWLCSCSPLYQSLMGSLLLAKSHFIQSRVRMTSPQKLSYILSLFLPLHHPFLFNLRISSRRSHMDMHRQLLMRKEDQISRHKRGEGLAMGLNAPYPIGTSTQHAQIIWPRNEKEGKWRMNGKIYE